MRHRRLMTAVSSILVAVAAGLFGLVVAPASPAKADTQEDQVFDRVNSERAAAGLPPLVRDAQIEAAAEEWANWMGTIPDPLTHSSNEWRASRLPAGWSANGENIAVGQTSATQVMTAWMASPGHRANILDGRFTRIGIGYAATPKGPTWVQILGAYASNPPPPPLTVSPTPTISGTARVAQTLTATAGTWGPAPVSLSFQWNAGGAPVAGATASSFLPDQTLVGKTVTVTVTGSRPGYQSASRTSAPTSPVTSPFATDRLAGADRYAVAIALAQRGYPGTAPVVYVATGATYPDALSAGPAAASQGGPLLLTAGNALPSAVAAEISRLRPATVVIVGGPASVSTDVERSLRALAPTVTRVAGADRFDVSRAIARTAFGSTGAGTAYVATGLNFPDALAAGGAGGHSGSPVLLVDGTAGAADSATLATLRSLGSATIKVAGGPLSVSGGIQSSLLAVGGVTRLADADRYSTGVVINLDAYSRATSAYLATGVTFPDALTGAALAGALDAPLFVVPTDCVPRTVLGALTTLGVTRVTVLGGPASLAPAVQNLAACAW
ncbi:cell wall-binding repeat-containing protein [Herbiconiux daphne]|uniref:Cell wall-binding repeat-containing protein n=1 Tax=Herbiconiux daphne TaxID=2970914 RepID=A0ABT2H4M1_9MICO|nr:cell wall-binding repeat-containing protein [Herbiconiux daphne]MCS5734880.1 cell wall-binding repeat-containing protein [Herbiconiux daphne]